ncbi:MAG: hypothetical protein ACI4QE_05220 [Acutalibacteraceae bacterium]
MTGYLYVFLWAFIAIYILYMGVKQKQIAYFVLSVLFFFLTGWYLADNLTKASLFTGTPGIIFKVVIGVFLVLVIVMMVLLRKKNRNN